MLPNFLSFVLICTLSFSSIAWARVEWQGQARAEWVEVSSTTLNGSEGAKSYVLTRMNLRPTVVFQDGVRGVFNLELFPNSQYPLDQMGYAWGSAYRPEQQGLQQQSPSQMNIREAYLRLEREYATVELGRWAFQFGHGAYFSAGSGAFDHFSDNFDGVSAKIYVGHLLIQPMLTTVAQPSSERGGGSNDQMLHLHYAHPDSKTDFAVLYRVRKGGMGQQTAELQTLYGSSGVGSTWDTQSSHLYFARGWDEMALALEAGFENGSTGLLSASNEKIALSGYGVNLDLHWRPQESLWQSSLRMGIASGDDPNTSNYEGFSWHYNHDIAFLMANHPLGSGGYDPLRNQVRRRLKTATSFYGNSEALDEATVSNMIYVVPTWSRQLGSSWTWRNRVTWAQAATLPSTATGTSRDLGWEYDLAFVLSPHPSWVWETEFGWFQPGNAYAEGINQRPKDGIWGFQTRWSVSF
jgi:hypothetical protein